MKLFEYGGVDDMNDVDEYGLDAHARKRLGLKGKFKAIRRTAKPKGSLQTTMPSFLRMEGLRSRSYEIRQDVAKRIHSMFYRAIPEFTRSIVGKIRKSGTDGYVASGSWPMSGKQVFDWEIEVYRDGRDYIVKYNLWSAKGKNIGETYRLSQSRAMKVVPKFAASVYRDIEVVKNDH